MAKRKRIPVEAEIGALNPENGNSNRECSFTDPHEAKEFVRLTGVDSLAISIGTSHGAYKFKDKPKLDFKRLQIINDVVDIPLVLHGASAIPQNIVKKGVRYGAKWKGAMGLDNKSLKKACGIGIDKVNIHTDMKLIRIASTREYFKKNPGVTDPRPVQLYAKEEVKKFVKKKFDILGSTGKV